MPAKHLLFTLVFYFTISQPLLVHADSSKKSVNETDSDGGQAMPSLELLEFLGDWEIENGQWIDPQDMDQIPLPDQDQENEENDHS